MRRIGIIAPTDGAEKLFKLEEGWAPIIIEPNQKELPELDFIVFCGGADVDPSLYNQKIIPGTHRGIARDTWEIKLWRHYKAAKKIGICRGAQFLCVMNGGKLYQDINNHTSCHHQVCYFNGAKIDEPVIGDHHQCCVLTLMMEPILRAEDYETEYEDDTGRWQMDFYIPEAFYIPDNEALCVQWHPEWGHKPSENLFNKLLKEYLL